MGKSAIDVNLEPSPTQQSAKDECDINFIVERAKRGADISHLNRGVPMYGDFTELPTDLRDCLNIVRKADEAFMSLDAQVRKRFDNDPSKMMDFLKDPANRDEAIKLGLVSAPKEPVVDPVVAEVSALRKDLASDKKRKAKPDDD